jgi:16S rRNA (uracil1498-N3)-methyltransferase
LRNKVSRHQIFYAPPQSQRGDMITFSPEESRHMLGSLRLAPGDDVTATDGAGCVLSVRIEDAGGRRVVGKILARRTSEAASPAIWVFQGIVTPARMDVLVEKCVELGIAGLVAVECERCVRRQTGPRLERWQRVAVEAMKQSMQTRLPEVRSASGLEDALGIAGGLEVMLLASGSSEVPLLREALGPRRPPGLSIWVGPEGGFTDAEETLLKGAGALPFRLGGSRLRSETAAIAAVGAVRALLG